MGHPVQKQHRLWLNKFNTQWYHIYSSQEPERVPRRPGAPLADPPSQPLQDHQAGHSHSQLQVRNLPPGFDMEKADSGLNHVGIVLALNFQY